MDKAELLPFQPVKALERSHHEGRSAFGDTGNLASQAFFFRKTGIDFIGNCNAEDTVVRSAPDGSFPVIGQFGDTVGAQSVLYVDAPDFLPGRVNGDDTVRGRGQQRAVSGKAQTLVHLDVFPAVHGSAFGRLASGEGPGIAAAPLRISDADGIPFKGQHLARDVDSFEKDRPFLIHMQAHHTGNVGSMEDSPFHIVVNEEAFKVGKESMPLTVTEDVKVTVVGIVLTGRIVFEVRDAHIGIHPGLRGSLHRERRHGGHKTDMIR